MKKKEKKKLHSEVLSHRCITVTQNYSQCVSSRRESAISLHSSLHLSALRVP